MIIISIYIIITTIVMVIIFVYHNQYNYPNNYQIINYSFKGYLLAEQWDAFLYVFLSSLFDWVLLFNVFCFCFINMLELHTE